MTNHKLLIAKPNKNETLNKKFIDIPMDDIQNYLFCRLNLLNEIIGNC